MCPSTSFDILQRIGESQEEMNNSSQSTKHYSRRGCWWGKSAVIKVMVQWMDKTLRTAGDDQTKPYGLLTGPTGTAASAINGTTLHTAFNFNFGNEYLSLSDKLRDKKRDTLSNLSALILDEGSMVSSDFLYKIDLRLKEIKERPNDDFGGGLSLDLS